MNQANGYNVPNFRRITVHGSTFPFEFLKLTIDPSANAVDGVNAFGPLQLDAREALSERPGSCPIIRA